MTSRSLPEDEDPDRPDSAVREPTYQRIRLSAPAFQAWG
jgi:hypothetical protein